MDIPEFPKTWPAPDEYLIELGRITALWGVLESSLNIAICKLSGYNDTLDWRCATLIAHSSFMQRLDVLATLCSELQQEYKHLSTHKTVIGKIKVAQRQRNKYAHNTVFLEPQINKVQVSYMSARGKLKTTTEDVEIEDLKKVCMEIHIATVELLQLLTQKKHPLIWENSANQGMEPTSANAQSVVPED